MPKRPIIIVSKIFTKELIKFCNIIGTAIINKFFKKDLSENTDFKFTTGFEFTVISFQAPPY